MGFCLLNKPLRQQSESARDLDLSPPLHWHSLIPRGTGNEAQSTQTLGEVCSPVASLGSFLSAMLHYTVAHWYNPMRAHTPSGPTVFGYTRTLLGAPEHCQMIARTLSVAPKHRWVSSEHCREPEHYRVHPNIVGRHLNIVGLRPYIVSRPFTGPYRRAPPRGIHMCC